MVKKYTHSPINKYRENLDNLEDRLNEINKDYSFSFKKVKKMILYYICFFIVLFIVLFFTKPSIVLKNNFKQKNNKNKNKKNVNILKVFLWSLLFSTPMIFFFL